LTHSQAAILFCFKAVYCSCETKICPRIHPFSSASNHCHPHSMQQPFCLFVLLFLISCSNCKSWSSQMKESHWHGMTGNSLWRVNKPFRKDLRLY